jgi:hypothetical protein
MMGRMGSVNIRRLAALDLHGTAGTRLRRRLVIAEFFLGAVGGAGFGVWIAVFAAAAGTQAFGGWMAGVGVNYAALAWQTIPLSRPGALGAELAGADVTGELRSYTLRQFWVVVPFLFAVLALRQSRGARAVSSADNPR